MAAREVILVHKFSESFAKSKHLAYADWWDALCAEAFDGFIKRVVVEDAAVDKKGVDSLVYTTHSDEPIKVEEKVREGEWSDILLEAWSSREDKVLGWTLDKSKVTDELMYVFIKGDYRYGYVINFEELRSAFWANGSEWAEEFSTKDSYNYGYTSVNIPVPVFVLAKACPSLRMIGVKPPKGKSMLMVVQVPTKRGIKEKKILLPPSIDPEAYAASVVKGWSNPNAEYVLREPTAKELKSTRSGY